MNKRWPLHPKPEDNQLLYEWVKDLADLYEVSYQHFCKTVLKLTGDEIFYFRNLFQKKSGRTRIKLFLDQSIILIWQCQWEALALM